MLANEITVRLDPPSMRILRELTEALNRQVEPVKPTTPDGDPWLHHHVHCTCGREATECYRLKNSPGGGVERETVFKCQGCGCIGSRDDRGITGAIRWG